MGSVSLARPVRRVLAVTLAFSMVATTASGGAWAQLQPGATSSPAPVAAPVAAPGPAVPGPGEVALVIRGDYAGLDYWVQTADGTPIRSCRGDCTVYVVPGRYRLKVGDTDDTAGATRKIEVRGPAVADVAVGSKSSRWTGLTLGSVGPVVLIVGLVGLTLVAADRQLGRNGDYTPWVLTMVAGAGLTTVGWIMFAGSFTSVKVQSGWGSGGPPRFAFGAVPVAGGALAGGTFTF